MLFGSSDRTVLPWFVSRGAFLRCGSLGLTLVALSGSVGCSATGGERGGAGGATSSGTSTGGAGGDNLFETSVECQNAATLRTSVGCDYYAVDMDALFSADNGCFVAFVANTSEKFAALKVTFGEKDITLGDYAKIPKGSGKALTYTPYNPVTGLPPGEVAILFLAGGYQMDPNDKPDPTTPVKCPVPAAIPQGAQRHGTSRGTAFHLQSSVPVVAYQMLPYGGGAAAVTGATLLIPTTAWDKSYIGVNAYNDTGVGFGTGPSMSLVARDDNTNVTIVPKTIIGAGVNVPGSNAGKAVTYTMKQGEVLQFTQIQELTGSPITSDKPIGLWAGHQCTDTPVGIQYCDHPEQQIPPVRALAHEYAAAAYRQRTQNPEKPLWRIIGAVDGTQLTYEPSVGAPTTVNLGDYLEFATNTPFVVRSQDAAHPFLLLGYMTGANEILSGADTAGYGDPDVVRIVPPDQYLNRYVFFTDPTYPETNLVVIRKKGASGFADVKLDCAGVLTGFTPLGSGGNYEMTRIDLVRHNFEPQGACDNGRHEMSSDAPFGVWVWAWGTPETQGGECLPGQEGYSCYVSYGYPAGEGLAQLNSIDFPPPK